MRILRSARRPVKVIDIISILVTVTVAEIEIVIIRGGEHARITYIVIMEIIIASLRGYGVVRHISERRTRRAVHGTYQSCVERVLRPRYSGVVTSRVHRTHDTTRVEVHTLRVCRGIVINLIVDTYRHNINVNIRRHIMYLRAVSEVTEHRAVIRALHTTDDTTDIESPSEVTTNDYQLLVVVLSLTAGRINVRCIDGAVFHVNITYDRACGNHTRNDTHSHIRTPRVIVLGYIIIFLRLRMHGLLIEERAVIHVVLQFRTIDDKVLDGAAAHNAEESPRLCGLLVVIEIKRASAPYLVEVLDDVSLTVKGTAESVSDVIYVL